MVDVYTVPNCQPCTLTKRRLDAKGITYTESDIDAITERAKAAGIGSAPVVVVDGQIAWGGFRPDRIDALVS